MARKKYSGEQQSGKQSPPHVNTSSENAESGAAAKGAGARHGSHSPPAGPSGSGSGSKDASYFYANHNHYLSFRDQLARLGLLLKDIPGDGNCLFRALGDQLEGNGRNHVKHRMDVVRYMLSRQQDFEPFIDVPFERYMDNLSRVGTYAGQDSLVAFARLHRCNIVIHQINSPLWLIEGLPVHGASEVQLSAQQANVEMCTSAGKKGATRSSVPAVSSGGTRASAVQSLELHLSYHNGEHYSSVRRRDRPMDEPARVFLSELLRDFNGLTPLCTAPSTGTTNTAPVSRTVDKLCVQQPHAVQQHDSTCQDAIRLIASMTQCGDSELIASAYEACGNNLEATVEYIFDSMFYESNVGQEPEMISDEAQIDQVISEVADLQPAVVIEESVAIVNSQPVVEAGRPCGKSSPPGQAHRRKTPAQQAHLSNRARKEQRRREKAEQAVKRRAKTDRQQRANAPPAEEQVDTDSLSYDLRCLNL